MACKRSNPNKPHTFGLYWFPTRVTRYRQTLPWKRQPDYQLRSWLRKMKETLKEFSLSELEKLMLTPEFGFGGRDLVYFALNSAPLSTTFVHLDRWPPVACNDSASGFKQGMKTFLAGVVGVLVMLMAGLSAVPATAMASVPGKAIVDTVVSKAKSHTPMQLNFLSATDILPIVWQIEDWDKKAYEHIDHLGIAEGTKIRDMMRKYWAWPHSPDEYKNLMSRLYTWMTREEPIWYDNYEYVWEKPTNSPTNHATNSRNILNNVSSTKIIVK